MRRITCYFCEVFLGAIEKGSTMKKGTIHMCYKCFEGFDGPGDGKSQSSMPDFMQSLFKGFGDANKARK